MFGKKLDEQYGEGTAEAILIESNKTKKWTVEELEEKCRYYRRGNAYLFANSSRAKQSDLGKAKI